MNGSPEINGADPAESFAPMRAALDELADGNARIRAIGARSGASAVAALDGFAAGDALHTALARWQRRTEAVDQALAEASTILGDHRPDPAA